MHGIALAWRQSDDLADAGIPAQNTRAVENFLRGLQRDRIKLDARSVVVVDELGLLGTRQLNELLRAQRAHGFQMIALGDPGRCRASRPVPSSTFCAARSAIRRSRSLKLRCDRPRPRSAIRC